MHQASLRSTHSSNQAACQTNRWSQQRDVSSCLLRCDCSRCNADTDTWHSVTARFVCTADSTLTNFEGRWGSVCVGVGGALCTHDHTRDNVCQQQQRCHCARETNAGLISRCGLGACIVLKRFPYDWGGSQLVWGAGFDLLCAWFNLRVELWPLQNARSKSHYLKAILSMIFFFVQASSLTYISTLLPTRQAGWKHCMLVNRVLAFEQL